MDHYAGWEPSYLKYTINLNEEALAGNLDPVASRDKEINQLINVLSRRTKNNPLLIGESGIGKTAIVEGLVQKIIANDVPKSLQNKIVLQLDFSSLVAGARHKGEFEQRLRELVSDLSKTDDVILFIDDIHLLLADNSERMNAAVILKKYLDDNLLSFIGATTQAQYEKYFDKNKSFGRDFQIIHVEEPHEEDAFRMLQVLRNKYEKFHDVVISDDILTHAISLSTKHINNRFLPDKALDLIDEASANVRMLLEKGKRGTKKVKKEDVEKIISDWIGIPLAKLTADESKKLLQLEKLIFKKFVGQSHAVSAVAEAVRRGRIGLGASNRPVASFLFLGKSGVGKTHLVKVLAEILHERDDSVLEIDMSEYMEKNDVSKLIGAPPGYNGYENGGILTEAVMRNPSTIILLDNIEKAHPDITNLLLQLLDEGVLHDNKGNKVNFKHTMVFCTSSGEKEQLNLSPELINRFDGIITFNHLTTDDMKAISRLLTAQTAERLKKQDFLLQITDQAVEEIAKFAGNPDEGARPLRRVVIEVIENPVAVAIISQKFKQGDTLLVEFITDKGFAVSSSTEHLLKTTNIMLPRISDIAKYDTAFTRSEEQRMQEVNNIYELLKKLSQLDSITDPDEKASLEEIHKLLLQEKEKGNPTADVILLAIQSLSGQKTTNVTLPIKNDVQVVSEEEFEEAKAIWLENYLDMSTSGNSVELQHELVSIEGNATENVIKLLTSEKTEDKEEAMKHLVSILPIFLIGGFTGEEIIAYLRAKAEAAKLALAELEDELDTTVLVKRTPQQPREKVMHIE